MPNEQGAAAPLRYWYFPGCSMETAAGYAQSVDALCRALGIELTELPDWRCCGASTFFSLDVQEALSLVARTLALAEREGATQIVTGCNGCFSTLSKGRKMILSKPGLQSDLQKGLHEEGLSLADPVPVRHLLEVLVEDVGVERWGMAQKDGEGVGPMAGVKVAPYYGCLFSRCPGSSDDPEHPTMLDRLILRLGLEIVDHGARTACCGASHVLPHGRSTGELVRRIVLTMQRKGAGVATTICPLCQFNLDSGQRGHGLEPLPVLFMTQLAGLALGLPAEELGLDKLLVRTNW
jgi:heterodisulfide reductase subunit B2